MSVTKIVMPRLSDTLNPLVFPRRCQNCGVLPFTADDGRTGPFNLAAGLHIWQEHDDADQPELIFVVLCGMCSSRLIEAHARLYRRLSRNEPAPGTMTICEDCVHRVFASRCKSTLARANGGPGLHWPAPDMSAFIDYRDSRGRRQGKRVQEWNAEMTECEGREPREVP